MTHIDIKNAVDILINFVKYFLLFLAKIFRRFTIRVLQYPANYSIIIHDRQTDKQKLTLGLLEQLFS